MNERAQEKEFDEELQEILSQCELCFFKPEIQTMFKDAIERMYYSESLKVRKSVLPQETVRKYLKRLNPAILEDALNKLIDVADRADNPIGYLMSIIINCLQSQKVDGLLHSTRDQINDSEIYASLAELYPRFFR